MSLLFFLNMLFFQWFFVRLTRLVPNTDRPEEYEWCFQYWILPLTGWFSFYPEFYVIGKGKGCIGRLSSSFCRNYKTHQ